MKKDILKIAGVKSEKEFYKKFPSEAAFMKAHGKEFKKAAMGASMVKKQLTQLTDFSNPPQAQVGKKIGGIPSQYQVQTYSPYAGNVSNNATYNQQTGMINSNTGQVGMADTQDLGFTNSGNKTFGRSIKDLNANDLQSGIQMTSTIGSNVQKISNAVKEKKQAKLTNALAPVIEEASRTRGEISKRQYVRPEDMAFGTQEMGQTYGVGTNYLAKNGMQVGGNLTEIQNMYNPGDIYSDLGYEPLSDSEIVKQYRQGGFIPKAQDGLGLIQEGVNMVGDITAGIIGIGTNKLNKKSNQILGQAAFQSGMQGVQEGQYSGFMEDGGWVSHDWQPQVIAKFGDYDMKDLLKADPTMDTLRAGGNITAQKGIGLLPSNPSGYVDSVINANKNIQFYKDVLAKKAPEISQFPGMFSETEIRGMDDSSEKNPYVGSRTSVKPYFSYVSGKYIPIEGMKEAYEDKTIPGINFPSQYTASVFEEEMTKKTKKQRAGGHLKSYTEPSEQAMSTERPEFAMGGELQTHWGGDAEPISYNPYLPDGGETVMFRGQSHEESDGQGRTGIGVTYGNNPVEVERGEPAVKLQDGGEEESLIVYGNMKIPSYGVSELGDLKAKGKKFKNYANDLSKIEARQNKIIEKATDRLSSLDPNTAFEKLEFDSLSATIEGANMKQKGLAIQKQRLAGIQNAILDTAKEQGLDSDALAKGKIKKAKDSDMAKFGAKMETAQGGINQPLSPILPMSTYYRINPRPYSPMVTSDETKKRLEEKPVETKTKAKTKVPVKTVIPERAKLQPITSIDIARKSSKDLKPVADITAKVPDYAKNLKPISEAETETKDKFGLMDLWRQVQPYTIPSNQLPLDPNQLTPEMYALAMNQLEPVQAQTFEPLLEQPYSVSLQDQLNANQADFNALQRQMGYNPAAASALAAQKYAANSAILGQQARINQEMQMGAFNRNRGVLNDAALKNLSILDQQYQRQSQAKSATKAQAQSALSSIADKIAKNKLENRTLGVYENMYNYRFGPKGRAYNVNAPVDWNMEGNAFAKTSGGKGQLAPGMEFTYDATGNIIGARKSSKDESTARNGSIVKAIKNL